MTFSVAGVRRFVCRASRYCSIEGCIQQLLIFSQIVSPILPQPYRFCDMIKDGKKEQSMEILRRVSRPFWHQRAGEGQVSDPLTAAWRDLFSLPSLFFSEYVLSCAAGACAH